ncbi:profilin-1B-like [Glandiceps talaboti]
MSWQSYVDSSLVGTNHIIRAAIHSLDNFAVWGTSANFNCTTQEVENLVKAFKGDPSALQAGGVKLGGAKFTYLRSDPESIYAKRGGEEGACIIKTAKTVIIGIYATATPAGTANKVVGSLGDYLKGQGY